MKITKYSSVVSAAKLEVVHAVELLSDALEDMDNGDSHTDHMAKLSLEEARKFLRKADRMLKGK